MKKLVFLFAFMGLICMANAQSLAFDKAVFLDIKSVIPTFGQAYDHGVDTTIVVPVGHVMKITSISSGYSQSTSAYYNGNSSSYHVYLNQSQVFGVGTSSQPRSEFPIWLPAGSYDLRFVYNSSSSTSSSVRTISFYLSGLQFEVVP